MVLPLRNCEIMFDQYEIYGACLIQYTTQFMVINNVTRKTVKEGDDSFVFLGFLIINEYNHRKCLCKIN